MVAINTLSPAQIQEGWKLLFDGESLAGWLTVKEPHGWVVEAGAIHCRNPLGGERNLYTVDQYEDFILSVEFKIDPHVNSGIFFRISDLENHVHTGLEVQVLDQAEHGRYANPKHWCGAIYDLVPPARDDAYLPAGEWNQALIHCEGPKVRVELNGRHMAELDVSEYTEAGRGPDGSPNKFKFAWSTLPRRGHIGLQDHGGKVWYRNIMVKEL